jgi:hypothetical protein
LPNSLNLRLSPLTPDHCLIVRISDLRGRSQHPSGYDWGQIGPIVHAMDGTSGHDQCQQVSLPSLVSGAGAEVPLANGSTVSRQR